MVRDLVADPESAAEVAAWRVRGDPQVDRCNHGCHGKLTLGVTITCVANP